MATAAIHVSPIQGHIQRLRGSADCLVPEQGDEGIPHPNSETFTEDLKEGTESNSQRKRQIILEPKGPCKRRAKDEKSLRDLVEKLELRLENLIEEKKTSDHDLKIQIGEHQKTLERHERVTSYLERQSARLVLRSYRDELEHSACLAALVNKNIDIAGLTTSRYSFDWLEDEYPNRPDIANWAWRKCFGWCYPMRLSTQITDEELRKDVKDVLFWTQRQFLNSAAHPQVPEATKSEFERIAKLALGEQFKDEHKLILGAHGKMKRDWTPEQKRKNAPKKLSDVGLANYTDACHTKKHT